MPSVIVKLSSSHARAWTHNQPVWLNPEGEVARAVSREEQRAISKALERSAKVKQSFRANLPLLPLNSSGRRTTQPRRNAPLEILETAFEITFVGEKRVVTVWNGPLRYATGREVLAAQLLADHGECIMHGRNGKCIGVLRDPFIQQREPQTGSRVQWSRDPNDPRKNEAERNELTDAAGLQRVSSVKRKKRNVALARSKRELYSPATCPNDCRGSRGGQAWKISDSAIPPTEEEHHPFCQYAAAWASTLEKAQTTEVLYDLELSQVKRSAAPSEIEEADDAERRTGMRQVTVAGRVYAVLNPEDAKTAALEARGEQAADAVDDDLEIALTSSPPEASPPTAPLSKEAERDGWPSLDDITPRGRMMSQATVSAKDYLARSVGEGPSAP